MEKVMLATEMKNLPAYFSQYLALAMRTAKNFGSLQMDLIHGALGIGSEMGELHEVITGAWLQIPTDINGISEELGDASWYCALLCHHMGWKFEDMFLSEEEASVDQLLCAAVLNRNVPALSCVANFHCGEILTLVKAHAVYGKPIDENEMRKHLQFFVTSLCLLSEAHNISYHDVTLPANIEKLRKRYPDKYSDVAAMERADKKIAVPTDSAGKIILNG